ncbi:hypothetical protein BCR34DRAFT_591536 [Clohesyomyces aquaticus]|uniref:Uncharacterized protein n=1 Tax=Clohesyomyces aquaticus TaxID=1231657 RepID=A0A1Y1Z177_9PLEO|nr:hypothetical protein BCR34DRAFT_591536 [Clohesyomyces aquaticus]
MALVNKTAITVRNATDSPLLRLSDELRNQTYQFATSRNAIFVRMNITHWLRGGRAHRWRRDCRLEAEYYEESKAVESISRVPTSNVFSLERACRQTNAEVSGIDICKGNILSFKDPTALYLFATYALRNEERKAIRTISIPDAERFLQGAEKFSIPFRKAFPILKRVLFHGRSLDAQDLPRCAPANLYCSMLFPLPNTNMWKLIQLGLMTYTSS